MIKYIQQPSWIIYFPIILPQFQYLLFQTPPHELNEEPLILNVFHEIIFVKMAHLAACAQVRVTECSRVVGRKLHLQSWGVYCSNL